LGGKILGYEFINAASTVLSAYALIGIAFAFGFITSYLKRTMRFRKTEFTQRVIEQNKEGLKLASKLMAKQAYSQENPFSDKEDLVNELEFQETITLLKFYNTLADGIDRGIYDEDLIRVNFEQEIKFFYGYSGPYLRKLRFFVDDEMFLPIEFLIREWRTKKKKKRVTFFG
jgi:hypothetical protein